MQKRTSNPRGKTAYLVFLVVLFFFFLLLLLLLLILLFFFIFFLDLHFILLGVVLSFGLGRLGVLVSPTSPFGTGSSGPHQVVVRVHGD
jgi:hypothetical protein